MWRTCIETGKNEYLGTMQYVEEEVKEVKDTEVPEVSHEMLKKDASAKNVNSLL